MTILGLRAELNSMRSQSWTLAVLYRLKLGMQAWWVLGCVNITPLLLFSCFEPLALILLKKFSLDFPVHEFWEIKT